MSETVQNQFHVDVDDPTRRYSLCCECGTVRFVRAGAVPRGRLRDEGDSPEHIAKMVEHFASSGGNPWWDTREPWLRCIEQLKCRTCGAVTSHAYIRSDESRNFAETVDRSRA